MVDYYEQIGSTTRAALSFWDEFIGGNNASIELTINVTSEIPRIAAGFRSSVFIKTADGFNIFQPGTSFEVSTGADINGSEADAQILINPNWLKDNLWFENNPFSRNGTIPFDKADATSCFIHEFGHIFGFGALTNQTLGTLPGDAKFTFDENILFDGINFFFTGSNAVEVYGSAVPLTFGNITHVSNSVEFGIDNVPRPGEDLIRDVMNGVVFF